MEEKPTYPANRDARAQLTEIESATSRRVHRLDRICGNKPAKLLDFKSLTLRSGSSRFGPVYLYKADRERHRHAENPDGCPNARPLGRRCNGRPSMAAAAPRLPETVPSRSCARHHNADTEESRSKSVT